MTSDRFPDVSRRTFIKGSSAAVAGAAIPAALGATSVHIGGDDIIRVGLIGCGGRGTGAAAQALTADPQTRLVAMGDAFSDRLESSLNNLNKNKRIGEQVVVDGDHCFTGFDAYKHVIESSDVVLLTATPHFRPRHLRAAIEAGKHVFCEKPVAVDGPGLRSVIESCKLAKQKKLNLVSGLCYRYDEPKQELMKHLHEGAVGDILAMECTYNTGGLWHRGSDPAWSEQEYQLRNWLYFTYLSGDHIAEQSIHSLDKILWAMKDVMPAKVTASGGRINRTDPKYGNVFDHFNTVFEWEGGLRLFHSCRQWAGKSARNVSDFVYGTKGTAAIQNHYIKGEKPYRWRGRAKSMYQREHDALFASIRAGEAINNGDYMVKATQMALMGRLAAYTGQTVTADQALNSQQDLTPKIYQWGDMPVAPVAIPGKTEFV